MSNRIAEIGMEKSMTAESAEVGKKSADRQNINHENIKKGYGAAGKHDERKYKAVSKNGDTLELSEAGSRLGGKGGADASPGKKVIVEAGGQISDAALSKYSKPKLRQLYASRQISRQQYERAMKKHQP